MKFSATRFAALTSLTLLLSLGSRSGAAPAPPSTASAGSATDPELAQVLERFDRVQRGVHSLCAEFSQSTITPLLRASQTASAE